MLHLTYRVMIEQMNMQGTMINRKAQAPDHGHRNDRFSVQEIMGVT